MTDVFIRVVTRNESVQAQRKDETNGDYRMVRILSGISHPKKKKIQHRVTNTKRISRHLTKHEQGVQKRRVVLT